MEVKSRKKSNLYDSIKKDNRCNDTVCGKKDELSELSKRLKLAKSTYDMLNKTLSEIDTKSPSHEDVMNATNEARKEYDTLNEMYKKKLCKITDTKLNICSLGNARITFPSELKINDDNIRGFAYIDGNINDLEVELYDTKYGDKTPLKLFNYLKDNQENLGKTINITIDKLDSLGNVIYSEKHEGCTVEKITFPQYWNSFLSHMKSTVKILFKTRMTYQE